MTKASGIGGDTGVLNTNLCLYTDGQVGADE